MFGHPFPPHHLSPHQTSLAPLTACDRFLRKQEDAFGLENGVVGFCAEFGVLSGIGHDGFSAQIVKRKEFWEKMFWIG